ncbi:hypothetical protein MHM39_14860 [Phaeobacter sp. CNT1-3]|nr:hypothetical protein [Phaeobacter sp. CNT1-3]
MAHQTGSGVALAISLDAPAAHNEAAINSISFDEVGEVTNIGEFGKEWALVTHKPLASRGTKKGKGSYDNGNLNPSLALDPNDAGQTAMETALNRDEPAYFRITLQDGTTYFLEGLVMKFRPNVGGVDDVVTAPTTIEITDKEILRQSA